MPYHPIYKNKVRVWREGQEGCAVRGSIFMGRESYLLSEVSDGTIEALLLALLISMPQKQAPTLLAIDEPEVNLHPGLAGGLSKMAADVREFQAVLYQYAFLRFSGCVHRRVPEWSCRYFCL